MKLLKRFFGNTPKKQPSKPFVFNDEEHSVIIYFNYGLPEIEPLFELEAKLMKVLEETGVGEYDGNEIADDNSDGSFYMYGPHAGALFLTIKTLLEATPFMKGAKVCLRYGPPAEDVNEIVVEI